MGSGVTVPEHMTENECAALCKSVGLPFDEARFEMFAEESRDDGLWRIQRSCIIPDIAKFARAKREASAAESLQLERTIRNPIKICLQELVETLDAIVADGLTPLVLDESRGHNVDTFMRYSPTSIFDAKKCGLDAALKKCTEEDALEAARKALVHAMKRGLTLVVCMQQASPPFSSWLNHPDFFPAKEVFARSGRGLIEDEAWAQRIFREEDTADSHGFAIPHKDFRVIVTSWFGSAADARQYHFAQNRAFSGVTGLHESLFQLVVIKNDGVLDYGISGASRVRESRFRPKHDHER